MTSTDCRPLSRHVVPGTTAAAITATASGGWGCSLPPSTRLFRDRTRFAVRSDDGCGPPNPAVPLSAVCFSATRPATYIPPGRGWPAFSEDGGAELPREHQASGGCSRLFVRTVGSRQLPRMGFRQGTLFN